MSVAARLTLGAALLLGLSLGSLPLRSGALAQEAGQPARTWTDPPARGAAVAPEARPSGEAAASPATPAPRSSGASSAGARPSKAKASVAARAEGKDLRQTRRATRTRVATRSSPRTLMVTALHPTRERVARPLTMRRSYGLASRKTFIADDARPVGRVEAPAPFGFRTADDRVRAAQAAGYIVIHARSVQFPDGRSLRTYQPVGEGDED